MGFTVLMDDAAQIRADSASFGCAGMAPDGRVRYSRPAPAKDPGVLVHPYAQTSGIKQSPDLSSCPISAGDI